MRPNFKVFIKKPTILNDSEIEIFEYTEEQLLELDYLEKGERILVTEVGVLENLQLQKK